MHSVFVLQHSYDYTIPTNEGDIVVEETKMLGIFSTEAFGKQAIIHYKAQAGFRDYPDSCFYLDEYVIDEMKYWLDGFITESNEGDPFPSEP